jgi:hypothetical protein
MAHRRVKARCAFIQSITDHLTKRHEMNPASLSNPLDRLFPPGAVATELRASGDPKLLLASEAVYAAVTLIFPTKKPFINVSTL